MGGEMILRAFFQSHFGDRDTFTKGGGGGYVLL